jgi:GDP-D-mannose dehydratase
VAPAAPRLDLYVSASTALHEPRALHLHHADLKGSFDQPEYRADVLGLGTLPVLEASGSIARARVKVYQAGSAEICGDALPQDEETPFHPRSP